MTVAVSMLPVEIINRQFRGYPRPLLELTCRVKNLSSSDICLLSAWMRIDTADSLFLDEGYLFHSMHNRVDPAIIRSGETALGAILIHLPGAVLQQVEERRQGKDIQLRISSRINVCFVEHMDERNILGVPFETEFGDPATGYLDYRIAQSDWVVGLKILGWSELEVFELPSTRLRINPQLGRALARFQDALDSHRRGEWEESMANCRKAFEAAMLDVSGKDDLKQGSTATLQLLVTDSTKANRLNAVISELSRFLHLARHESPQSVLIKRADSQLAIHLTAAVLDYLANA